MPYTSHDQLRCEICEDIAFWEYEHDGKLNGVMGIQPMQDITLILLTHVRTGEQNEGIGGKLFDYLLKLITTPVLIGAWAIHFYKKYEFQRVSMEEKNRLLKSTGPFRNARSKHLESWRTRGGWIWRDR